jgi:MYXO-CTERM domain-containing protein
MRTTWLSIVVCAILLCWAAQTATVSTPGKPPPPPPCQTCEAPADAGEEDAASEVEGGVDAATADSGVGVTTPDAATVLDSGNSAAPTAGSSGCGLAGEQPDPAEGVAVLAVAALVAVRLHRRKRTES